MYIGGKGNIRKEEARKFFEAEYPNFTGVCNDEVDALCIALVAHNGLYGFLPGEKESNQRLKASKKFVDGNQDVLQSIANHKFDN